MSRDIGASGLAPPPLWVAGAIATPLTGQLPDAARGRAVLTDVQRGNCLICHRVPGLPEEPFQGNLGPPLDGVGARLAPAQLRARLVDSARLDPDSAMPAYHRIEGFARVAPSYRGRPVLSALEIEDLIAFLSTLQGP